MGSIIGRLERLGALHLETADSVASSRRNAIGRTIGAEASTGCSGCIDDVLLVEDKPEGRELTQEERARKGRELVDVLSLADAVMDGLRAKGITRAPKPIHTSIQAEIEKAQNG